MRYAQQVEGERWGKHRRTLAEAHFAAFPVALPAGVNPDMMLEIKKEEANTLRAAAIISAVTEIS